MTATRAAMDTIIANLELAIPAAHRDLYARLPSQAPGAGRVSGSATRPHPIPDPPVATRYRLAQRAITQAWHITGKPLPPSLSHPDRHAHPRALVSTVGRIASLWSTLTADEQQQVLEQLDTAAGKRGLLPWWREQPAESRCHADWCNTPKHAKGLCRSHYDHAIALQRQAKREARP